MISSVPLCPESLASKGECSDASKIGHAAVASGPGPYPLTVPQPGSPESPIDLTGPYQGAPFGLSILTHVIAGPFNLGKIVTRAKIEIDPRTAQITVTTDPLPQIVAGVPTDLRLINAVIDRPNFLFNPTNCCRRRSRGRRGARRRRARVAPARRLRSRAISVWVRAESWRSRRSSRRARVRAPVKRTARACSSRSPTRRARMGTQSWFKEAKFDIPKQLPARLTTIQKACLASDVRSEPRGLPAGVADRPRGRAHPGAAGPA